MHAFAAVVLLVTLGTAGAFAPASLRRRAAGSTVRPLRMAAEEKHTLVLLRHGESTWNAEGLFTGWYDCPLSESGAKEAVEGGRLLKQADIQFDMAYTSMLKRAIQTLWLSLEELDQMWIPVVRSWKLNERHYGALQGRNKQQTVDKYGKEQVQIWRRSYATPPPDVEEDSEHFPGNDVRYKDVPADQLPRGESLAMTGERVIDYWEEVISKELKAGKRVLIAAHGNSLRALVKHLDDISEEDIVGLNIPTGVPLVYKLDENLKPIKQDFNIEPLSGFYLGDQEEVMQRIAGVAAQTEKK